MKASTGEPVWYPSESTGPFAIVAALALERDILTAAVRPLDLDIYCSGPGPVRAAAIASRAIDAGAKALMSWGLAGGLSAVASPGSVALPKRLLENGAAYEADDAWHRRLAGWLGNDFEVYADPLVSVDAVVTTPEAKASLAEQTGAAVVDMESASIAAVAARAAVPFVALRVVADGFDDALPDNVAQLVTVDGRTRWAGLIGVVASPRRARALATLAQRSNHARRTLRAVAAKLGEAQR